jgi:hypothetical protein
MMGLERGLGLFAVFGSDLDILVKRSRPPKLCAKTLIFTTGNTKTFLHARGSA